MAVAAEKEVEYRGWLIRIETTHVDEVFAARADLLVGGRLKCRLALTTPRLDRGTAHLALLEKAHTYIDDWMSREHSGDTDFQPP